MNNPILSMTSFETFRDGRSSSEIGRRIKNQDRYPCESFGELPETIPWLE